MLAVPHSDRNTVSPRTTRLQGPLLLVYRRGGWQLSTANRWKWFETLEQVGAFLNRLRARRAAGPIQARLEEVSPVGARRELPLAAVWETLDAEERAR